jgi:transposase
MGEVLAMTARERERLRVIEAIREGRMTQAAAAQQLSLTIRQIKRLCRAYRRRGARGLLSRKRGHPSNRRIDASEQRRIIKLIREHYVDFGPTLAGEYLREHHGYRHSVETLRQWMISADLWRAKQKAQRPVHQLRERRARSGELVQIDGSPHDWLEQRGPRCCLLVFIDDCTGALRYARFVTAETSRAYLDALHAYVHSYGRPVAFYSDRHSIFTKHDPEDPAPTQFERAVRALDIEPILAMTPQAKGRVERAFRTLQDRLVKALRLAGICTVAAANAFLPQFLIRHNARFARFPVNPADAHRRGPHDAEELRLICCEQHERTLSRSLSCQYRGQLYILTTNGAAAYHLQRTKITVCDPGYGHPVVLLYRGKPLPYRVFSRPALVPRTADDHTVNELVEAALHHQKLTRHHLPLPTHPWRQSIKPNPRPR